MIAVARRLQQRRQPAAMCDLQVARARSQRSKHCIQPLHHAQQTGLCGLRVRGPGMIDGSRID
eukprot:7387739-Prymnesium_polylepis.1